VVALLVELPLTVQVCSAGIEPWPFTAKATLILLAAVCAPSAGEVTDTTGTTPRVIDTEVVLLSPYGLAQISEKEFEPRVSGSELVVALEVVAPLMRQV
jgi:hypothetical protein